MYYMSCIKDASSPASTIHWVSEKINSSLWMHSQKLLFQFLGAFGQCHKALAGPRKGQLAPSEEQKGKCWMKLNQEHTQVSPLWTLTCRLDQSTATIEACVLQYRMSIICLCWGYVLQSSPTGRSFSEWRLECSSQKYLLTSFANPLKSAWLIRETFHWPCLIIPASQPPASTSWGKWGKSPGDCTQCELRYNTNFLGTT